MKNILIELDDEIHAKFKSKCALERIHQKDKIVDLIKDYSKRK